MLIKKTLTLTIATILLTSCINYDDNNDYGTKYATFAMPGGATTIENSTRGTAPNSQISYIISGTNVQFICPEGFSLVPGAANVPVGGSQLFVAPSAHESRELQITIDPGTSNATITGDNIENHTGSLLINNKNGVSEFDCVESQYAKDYSPA